MSEKKQKNKKIFKYFIGLLLCILVTTFIIYMMPQINKTIYAINDNTLKMEPYIPDDIPWYSPIGCTYGKKETTVIPENGFKYTFSCLANSTKDWGYQQYKLNNGKILLLNWEDSYLFNPINKDLTRITIDDNLEKKDLQLNDNNQIPQNINFINSEMFFDIKENKLYSITDQHRSKLRQYEDKYDVNTILIIKNSKHYSGIGSKGHHSEMFNTIIVKDFAASKYYKPVKLNYLRKKIPGFLFKEDNVVVIGGENTNIELYNFKTGDVTVLGKTKHTFSEPQLFLYQKDKVVICENNTIEIFDINAKQSTVFKQNYVKLPTYALFETGQVLIYDYVRKQSVIFDINTKKFHSIKNLNNNLRFYSDRMDENNNYLLEKPDITVINDSTALISGGFLDIYTTKKNNTSIELLTIEKIKK